MKRAVLIASTVVLLLNAIPSAQADVFASLGSTAAEAQNTIFSSFSGGYVYFPGTRQVFKTATTEARVALVTAVVNFARTYSTSADFAKRYATYRDGQKPSPPEPAKTGDQMREEQKKGLQDGIANMEKMAKEMPSMKKDMDTAVAQLKQQLAQIGTDPAFNAQMDQALKANAEAAAADYKTRLAEWEKNFPADSKGMVAGRLREFLAAAATVDFAAATAPSKENPKRMKFVNPEFESKDAQWKYMYRAGKPSVDAARAIAQEWLKAIGG